MESVCEEIANVTVYLCTHLFVFISCISSCGGEQVVGVKNKIKIQGWFASDRIGTLYRIKGGNGVNILLAG